MSDLRGNRVFINQAYFAETSVQSLVATMAHDVVHNTAGLTDPDIDRAWARFGTQEGGGSMDIGYTLRRICF
jgi:hypothetical protein